MTKLVIVFIHKYFCSKMRRKCFFNKGKDIKRCRMILRDKQRRAPKNSGEIVPCEKLMILYLVLIAELNNLICWEMMGKWKAWVLALKTLCTCCHSAREAPSLCNGWFSPQIVKIYNSLMHKNSQWSIWRCHPVEPIIAISIMISFCHVIGVLKNYCNPRSPKLM